MNSLSAVLLSKTQSKNCDFNMKIIFISIELFHLVRPKNMLPYKFQFF